MTWTPAGIAGAGAASRITEEATRAIAYAASGQRQRVRRNGTDRVVNLLALLFDAAAPGHVSESAHGESVTSPGRQTSNGQTEAELVGLGGLTS